MSLRGAYALTNARRGRTVFIVAPGPSAIDFPLRRLDHKITIAVNRAIDLIRPTWWLWADYGIYRDYQHELHRPSKLDLVVESRWARALAPDFVGRHLYTFHRLRRNAPRHWLPTGLPFWYGPRGHVLGGRASITACAISLAWILGARRCVLVGTDFNHTDLRYAPGVRLADVRVKSLRVGARWLRRHLHPQHKANTWPGLDVATCSRHLHRRLWQRTTFLTVEQALTPP